jgi:succinyl-diaminopimelate desuccinylase
VPALRSAYLAETGTVLVSGGSDGHEAYTDASMLGALTGSRDCTVFGPGSSDFAHVPDEHVPIADLEIAYGVIRRLCREWGREAR